MTIRRRRRVTPDRCVGRGGASGGHCCWVDGAVCPFLERQSTWDGRQWACGLRRELGSWPAVHADHRYRTIVQPVWDRVGIESCGAWQPKPGECCREER
jgi:hypothetical protein